VRNARRSFRQEISNIIMILNALLMVRTKPQTALYYVNLAIHELQEVERLLSQSLIASGRSISELKRYRVLFHAAGTRRGKRK
jgi:hypothetical protein